MSARLRRFEMKIPISTGNVAKTALDCFGPTTSLREKSMRRYAVLFEQVNKFNRIDNDFSGCRKNQSLNSFVANDSLIEPLVASFLSVQQNAVPGNMKQYVRSENLMPKISPIL